LNILQRDNMPNLNSFVSDQVLEHLTMSEKKYLINIFQTYKGYPSLEQIWGLMDEVWLELGCDPTKMDEKVAAFYRHPVWMLNGLFIEQHPQSLANRHEFTNWVVRQAPMRIADFGGGFGGLARFIGQALPAIQVEVVEPHPHPAGIELVASTPNVRFVPELTRSYDLLIATDVFEHVLDPLALCAHTMNYLKLGGQYLIANCFQPVIKCHLPQLFYFEYGWESALTAMGLKSVERVSYGRAYRYAQDINLSAARQAEKFARKLYPLLKLLPRGRARTGRLLMKLRRFR